MGDNNISDEGAISISDALKHNVLNSLNLGNKNITCRMQ